jgi:hypothetical protein
MFSGKDPKGNAENEVSIALPIMKLDPAQFHGNFRPYLCLESSEDVVKCLPGSSFCRI